MSGLALVVIHIASCWFSLLSVKVQPRVPESNPKPSPNLTVTYRTLWKNRTCKNVKKMLPLGSELATYGLQWPTLNGPMPLPLILLVYCEAETKNAKIMQLTLTLTLLVQSCKNERNWIRHLNSQRIMNTLVQSSMNFHREYNLRYVLQKHFRGHFWQDYHIGPPPNKG